MIFQETLELDDQRSLNFEIWARNAIYFTVKW